eukprot:CAMPEP_0170273418 /NCGR_PEP_ID=MMETSP0116_2-20130129/36672_1 /TAXON_ID=400756 /ORGANISM="Durinskia baltica, Strain CSIRO CS-38" /LENGTH=154 /DNA_ID=CAMNT_0010524647 /DNA_START=36 /DNA_END=501 /DNA_ORIENTATION=+
MTGARLRHHEQKSEQNLTRITDVHCGRVSPRRGAQQTPCKSTVAPQIIKVRQARREVTLCPQQRVHRQSLVGARALARVVGQHGRNKPPQARLMRPPSVLSGIERAEAHLRREAARPRTLVREAPRAQAERRNAHAPHVRLVLIVLSPHLGRHV